MRRLNILFLSFLFVFLIQTAAMADTEAATGAQEEITLQQAVDRALEMSRSLKISQLEKDTAKEEREDAQDQVNYTPTGEINDDIKDAYITLLQKELSYQTSVRNIESLERDITVEVVEKYAAIYSARADLEDAEAALEDAEYDRNIAQKKLQAGIIAQYQLDQADSNLVQKETALKDAQANLGQAYEDFNVLLGSNVDQRPILVSSIEYPELEVTSVDAEVSRALNNSTDVWSALKEVTLAEVNLRTSDSYDISKINIEIAELNASEAQEALETSLRDKLDSMEGLRNQITSTETSIKDAKAALSRAEKKYGIGTGTQADVVQAKVDLTSQENKLAGLRFELASLMASYNCLTGRAILPEGEN